MAAQRFIPSSSCRMHEADGSGWSGEAVATTSRSTSEGSSPATARARSAAILPIEPFDSAGPAIRRSLMPVRSVIHWSLVSTSCSRSALVRTYGGTAVPSPTISAATTAPFLSGPSCGPSSTVPVPFSSRCLATPTLPPSRKLPMSLERSQAEQDLAGCDQFALPGQMRHDLAAEGASDRDARGSVAHLAQHVAGLHVRPVVGEPRKCRRVEAPVTRRDREALREHDHLPLVGAVARCPVAPLAQRLDDLGHALGVTRREHADPLPRALISPDSTVPGPTSMKVSTPRS